MSIVSTSSPGGYAKHDFFAEELTTDQYEELSFIDAYGNPFVSGGIMIICDSANAVDISFDGENLHGTLYEDDTASFDGRNRERIYIKSHTPGSASQVRIFAW